VALGVLAPVRHRAGRRAGRAGRCRGPRQPVLGRAGSRHRGAGIRAYNSDIAMDAERGLVSGE